MQQLFVTGLLLSMTVFSSPAIAQTSAQPNDEDEGQICILVAYVWNGTPEDVQRIREQPVPESYKRHKGGACGGRADPSNLIGWHLRYGTETTVEQALRYIEGRDGSAEAMAAGLDRDLTKALTKLDEELNREREAENSRLDLSNPEKQRIFVVNMPSVNDLGGIKNTLNFNLLNNVNLYLSAAEVFKSRRLAAHARKRFASYRAIEEKLLPTRDGGKADMDVHASKALEYVQDSSSRNLTSLEIDLRLAVLEVTLDPSPEKLGEARQTIERRRKPVYANAPKEAFSGGDQFCDLNEERFRNDWEREIAAACKSDYAFVDKAMAYGYADAMLAILTDSEQRFFGMWDWEDYVILHQKDAIHDHEIQGSLAGPDERVVDLKLAVADRNFSKTKAGEKGHWSYETAWQLLTELIPLANPAENPVRFRKIAERAIAVDDQMQKDDKGWGQRHAPLRAYFRLNLKNLDKLAGGMIR